MYMPAQFQENRPEELLRILTQFPLGALVVYGPDGLDANHIPFEFHPDKSGAEPGQDVLLGHVARANPVWQQVRNGDPVLVIFRADNGYVSPNWYPSKHETHKTVPTWNYQVVHVHGRIVVHDDEKFVRGVVARLTRQHETQAGEAKPWKMTDSAPDFIDGMLAAIVGIEIKIDRIVGKSKISQNRTETDRNGAEAGLRRLGNVGLADAIQNADRPLKP